MVLGQMMIKARTRHAGIKATPINGAVNAPSLTQVDTHPVTVVDLNTNNVVGSADTLIGSVGLKEVLRLDSPRAPRRPGRPPQSRAREDARSSPPTVSPAAVHPAFSGPALS
jgi:hypothetical protein